MWGVVVVQGVVPVVAMVEELELSPTVATVEELEVAMVEELEVALVQVVAIVEAYKYVQNFKNVCYTTIIHLYSPLA